ncbi:unnamed protein product, partial [Meganyctiphanes norvegica]
MKFASAIATALLIAVDKVEGCTVHIFINIVKTIVAMVIKRLHKMHIDVNVTKSVTSKDAGNVVVIPLSPYFTKKMDAISTWLDCNAETLQHYNPTNYGLDGDAMKAAATHYYGLDDDYGLDDVVLLYFGLGCDAAAAATYCKCPLLLLIMLGCDTAAAAIGTAVAATHLILGSDIALGISCNPFGNTVADSDTAAVKLRELQPIQFGWKKYFGITNHKDHPSRDMHCQHFPVPGVAHRNTLLKYSKSIFKILSNSQCLNGYNFEAKTLIKLSDAVFYLALQMLQSHPEALILCDDDDDDKMAASLQRTFTARDLPRPPSHSEGLVSINLGERREYSLNTEYAQVEVIDLVNDGSGLGFGIIGGRSTGVVVKTILPGGVADRDGRLQSGDHILQIGNVNLRGMGSDQVAAVLRQSGSYVRLIVARPIDVNDHCRDVRSAPIIETRVLNDPDDLERQLSILQNTFPLSAEAIAAAAHRSDEDQERVTIGPSSGETNGHYSMYTNGDPEPIPTVEDTMVGSGMVDSVEGGVSGLQLSAEDLLQGRTFTEEELAAVGDLPEMETIELELHKDHQGLGITIAGYVCEREYTQQEMDIFANLMTSEGVGSVRMVSQLHIQVDGTSLSGLSNHAAVDVLRATGAVVHLRLARYLRGPKYEQLQQAIANSELKTTPTTPNPPRAPLNDGAASSEALRSALDELEDADTPNSGGAEPTVVEAINPGLSSITTIIADVPTLPAEPDYNSPPLTQPPPPPFSIPYATTNVPHDLSASSPDANDAARLEDIELMIDNDYQGGIRPSVENAICRKWSRIVGPEFDIVVAQLSKFEEGGGLGISLEGTVDVEGGREVRPHHYIRSILPDGPVGKNSKLQSADELLEVNGQKLLGLNHVEVVGILKDLPRDVRLVCGRRAPGAPPPLHPPHAANPQSFAARNILGGSLQSLVPGSERLVKAKSDGSLASSTNNANCESPWGGASDSSFNRIKSRSLEPLTGLAMWSSQPQIIELNKGDRGLGFSILDYQDPLNPQETVIVIRSLVPGGVAEKDGRLIPGDRLVAVNGTCLENATLDQAVAALKGAPKGPVSIAVAKPISVLESTGQQQVSSNNHDDDVPGENQEYNENLLSPGGSSPLVKSESF